MTVQSGELPNAPRPTGTLIDARLHLLDRQMLDADGTPVGIVDDLEIEIDDRVPRVTAILTGRVLFTRMFGGQQPRSRLQALPWRLVTKLDAAVHLSPEADQFDGLWIEHWLRDRLIARIPGGRHAAQ
ncbi:sporulation protein YlmC with PRC-barrel domain [Mycolicibacterium sp. BK556]|uniref:PRC-barrel domain-containing protein n=2 Tax=Mycobacteriaceae TaxID=1762 RepID=UPI00106103E9|nr:MULTISPECIES: hypothetical protein [Mycobacteriaceae]MBB3602652.1 sporulation protein YlmC with PRC-barrel domain [Mycolicibacterium sp. BK556]MBB3632404.1 sporulation protein YlmC with PRC-barrel domain [Mycolicibacterium sp. BK607]TDO18307.1 hypothetical protein EV580_1493 [Mycobacterium sp. BK086]